jgi:hypothetical protein
MHADAPYRSFAINLILSGVVMYLAMFSMIWRLGDFFNNLNTFYMVLMMVAPMGVLMLLMMTSMYSNRRLNIVLHLIFALLFVAGLVGMRQQSLVGDEQFLRSMIPHHSGAILMCERADLSDPEIKALCQNIVRSQAAEIGQMKRILARR